MIAKLRAWLAGREPRERVLLVGGSVVATLLVLYALVWSPISTEADRLSRSLPKLRADAAAFGREAAEAERLRATTQSRPAPKPLAIAVQESAPRFNVQTAIKSVQALGPDRAQVAMGPVSFDSLMLWLGDLAQSAGITVETLQLSSLAEPGKVAVDGLVLRGGR